MYRHLAYGACVPTYLNGALTRYHRMLGDNTLWQPGTDHAGIATQIVVERQLDQQKLDRRVLAGKLFWSECGNGRKNPALRLPGKCGAWGLLRLDTRALHHGSALSRAVTEVFVRLYREGLIYRGKRLVNWTRCCKQQFQIWK